MLPLEYVWTQGQTAATERLGTRLWILDYAQARQIPVLLGEWSAAGPAGPQPRDDGR